jgi:hypothetical protein
MTNARRPWTAQDQVTAEVAAACGCSCREIGRIIGRDSSVVRRRLSPAAAESLRILGRRWRDANRDRDIWNSRRWRQANPERAREACRRWYQKQREVVA